MKNCAAAAVLVLCLGCHCAGRATSTPAPRPEEGVPEAGLAPDAALPPRTGPGPRADAPKAPPRPPDASTPSPEVTEVHEDGCEGGTPRSVWEFRTCCNGKVCAGECVLFAGSSTPICLCAVADGGCPGDWGCCRRGGCLPLKYCDPPN